MKKLSLIIKLAIQIYLRENRSSTREAFLGYFWIIVPPVLVQLGALLISSAGIINSNLSVSDFSIYVMMGYILWQGFLDSLMGPIRSFKSSKSHFSKFKIPSSSVFLAKQLDILTSYFIKLLVAGLFVFYFNNVNLIDILLGFVFSIGLPFFGLTLGLFLLPVFVLFNDIQRGFEQFIPYLIFLTPALYVVPDKGMLRSIIDVNPISHLMISVRNIFFGQDFSILQYSAILLSALPILFFSSFVIKRGLPIIIERSG